jgi:predicted negative regulator of RcsB-dependent stress response
VPSELAAGVTRFALDTGRVAAAIPLAGQLKGDSADYLNARVLLASGQHSEAKALLERVFNSSVHRAEAAIELARLAEVASDQQAAGRWYQGAVRTGFGEVRQIALLNLAEIERRQGKTDRAGQYLASMDDGYWAAVGYMNLAADFARDDLNPSRALVSLRVAMAMAAKDPDSDRSSDLRDQLYLRAGYLSVRNQDYDKATDFLEKVSLESYHTPQALYLHGFALSEKGNHRAAMQSWHRAKKFPLAFPGVADAWIGMGRGYDLAGYPGQAGEAWLAANAAYEGERVTLGKLAERVRADGAYKALVEDARGVDTQWFLADSRTLTQPRLAYLLRFLESAEGQLAVGRVARLDDLAFSLESSKHDLDVFIGAMENSRHGGEGGQLAALQDQQDTLTRQLEQLADRPLSADHMARLRQLQSLTKSGGLRLSSLPRREAGRQAQLRANLNEARRLRDEISGLQARVSKARARAAEYLDEQALALVAAEQQRMAHSLDKTEQQIAHLYEYLALENIGEAAR